MKFPRNTKIFRGQLDAAPFASVLFVFMTLMLLHPALVFLPGVPVNLPETVDLPGTTNAKAVVVIDRGGQIYFDSQAIDEAALKEKLEAAVLKNKGVLTLVVQADKETKHETLVRLAGLAREVGIREVLLATRPQLVPAPARPEVADGPAR
ncbi:MAG TPA: biopolymer transporter ExbD [Verrucomicrobiae bacterium]|nr:biopolymer transporter ExbD [Verrucomicrobiae bacterium]